MKIVIQNKLSFWICFLFIGFASQSCEEFVAVDLPSNQLTGPIVFEDEATLLRVQKALNDEGIFPRRYFYPSLNTIEYLNNQKMLISESIASRILCLPLYVGLNLNTLKKIIQIINQSI